MSVLVKAEEFLKAQSSNPPPALQPQSYNPQSTHTVLFKYEHLIERTCKGFRKRLICLSINDSREDTSVLDSYTDEMKEILSTFSQW